MLQINQSALEGVVAQYFEKHSASKVFAEEADTLSKMLKASLPIGKQTIGAFEVSLSIVSRDSVNWDLVPKSLKTRHEKLQAELEKFKQASLSNRLAVKKL